MLDWDLDSLGLRYLVNYSRKQDKELFCEQVDNDVVKIFPVDIQYYQK